MLQTWRLFFQAEILRFFKQIQRHIQAFHVKRSCRSLMADETGYDAAMASLAFTPHLRHHLNCPDGVYLGGTVADVLAAAFAVQPKLRGYVLDDQGCVRQHVTIFVNGQALRDRQRQSDPVNESDEVFVFQALSGG